MGQNLTLANNENGDLYNGETYSADRFNWYTGTNNGYIKLNLALSDLDLAAHTIKITTNWMWRRSSGSGAAWNVNGSNKPYLLYATGTSSSSGTSKTYHLYTGGNKGGYSSTTDTEGFNWAYAYGTTTFADINYNATSATVNNEVIVDLAPDNSLVMTIQGKIDSSASSSYGPRSDKTWTSYTLTINPTGAFLWVNDGGTWKRGLVYVNDGGTWKVGKATYINAAGTWTKS